MRIFKTILFSLVLSIALLAGFVVTQSKLYWPVINWILKMKGLERKQGDEKGTAVSDIVFTQIFPLIFLISLAIILFVLEKEKTIIITAKKVFGMSDINAGEEVTMEKFEGKHNK